MVFSSRKNVMLLVVCVALLAIISQSQVSADVHIGSCVWGAVDYTSNCLEECKRRGYKGGHCGSIFNVNCWCET